MKKLIVLLLAAALICSLTVIGFAEESEELDDAAEFETVETIPEEIAEEELTADPEETEPEIEIQPEVIETIYAEDMALEADLAVAENEIAAFRCKVTVPSGVTLTISGTAVIEGEIEVAGTLKVESGAELVVEKDAALVLTSVKTVNEETEEEEIVSAAELVNMGRIDVKGTITLQDGVVFGSTNNAIILQDEGKAEGTKHFVSSYTENGETIEVKELTAEDFAAICEAGILADGASYVLKEDAEIAENAMLLITDGTLRVPEGVALTVKGALMINGGSVLVVNGAKLNNELYINVGENGRLVVGGEYIAADTSAIVWDQSKDNCYPIVTGVDRELIDCITYAGNQAVLNQAVTYNNYRTLTIYINDPELVASVGTIADGVVINLRG